MDQTTADRFAIRELVDRWALWRDAGNWDELRTLWIPGGRIITLWTEATGDEFVKMSAAAAARGVKSLHSLGGHLSDVRGNQAIAQTKMQINLRTKAGGQEVDVTCAGRFYDFLEKRDDRWGIVLRQPIYEKDRLDPVMPGAPIQLDLALLESFPVGYRHLAYVQASNGVAVRRDMPCSTGERVEALYRAGASWLRGEALEWPAK